VQDAETKASKERNEISYAMSTFPTSERPPKDEDTRSTTSAEDSDVTDEEGWEDLEPDQEESQPIVGLFSDKIYPDVNAMLQESKDKHDFDLRKIQKEFGVYSTRN